MWNGSNHRADDRSREEAVEDREDDESRRRLDSKPAEDEYAASEGGEHEDVELANSYAETAGDKSANE